MSGVVRPLVAFLDSTAGHVTGLAGSGVLVVAELSLLRFGWDMLLVVAPLVALTLLGMGVVAEEIAKRLILGSGR